MKQATLMLSILLGLCWSAPAPAQQAASATTSDVTFIADCDGTLQRYVVMLPSLFEPGTAHDVLIALHGHGSDRWQFVTATLDECRAARDVASERDMIFVSPDYRATTSWMGPKAEADVVQIIRLLREQYRVARVFVCGGSMGGTASLTFTALHPDLIAGVASMNGTANFFEYENFQSYIQQSFGGTKAEIPLEYKNRSAEYWPERFTMPVGITAGGQDTLVPPDSVRRLAHVLETIERSILLIYREAMGHSTVYADARAILEYSIDQADPAGDGPDLSVF